MKKYSRKSKVFSEWSKKIKEEENKTKNEKEKEKEQNLANSLKPEEKTYNQLKILNLLKVDASPVNKQNRLIFDIF